MIEDRVSKFELRGTVNLHLHGTVCVLFNTFFSIFFVNEPYQHSWCFTKPNKSLLTSSSRLFTHPKIPRLLQDQEIVTETLCAYVVSFHHASTVLEKLGWKSFITLLTRNSGGIFYPSSGISSLVQASILIFLIRIFLSSFNSCMSSCNPLMESLRSVTVCYLFSCSPKVGHCSQCIKQLPHFGSWYNNIFPSSIGSLIVA